VGRIIMKKIISSNIDQVTNAWPSFFNTLQEQLGQAIDKLGLQDPKFAKLTLQTKFSETDFTLSYCHSDHQSERDYEYDDAAYGLNRSIGEVIYLEVRCSKDCMEIQAQVYDDFLHKEIIDVFSQAVKVFTQKQGIPYILIENKEKNNFSQQFSKTTGFTCSADTYLSGRGAFSELATTTELLATCLEPACAKSFFLLAPGACELPQPQPVKKEVPIQLPLDPDIKECLIKPLERAIAANPSLKGIKPSESSTNQIISFVHQGFCKKSAPEQEDVASRNLDALKGEVILIRFDYSENVLELDVVVVHQEFKHQGLGKIIVQGLKDFARKKQIPYIFIEQACEDGLRFWPEQLQAHPIEVPSTFNINRAFRKHFFKNIPPALFVDKNHQNLDPDKIYTMIARVPIIYGEIPQIPEF
jgi:hypothetical protein